MRGGFVDRGKHVEESIEVDKFDRLSHEAFDTGDGKPATVNFQAFLGDDERLQACAGNVVEVAAVEHELGVAAIDVALDAIDQKRSGVRIELSGHLENQDVRIAFVRVGRVIDHWNAAGSWREGGGFT